MPNTDATRPSEWAKANRSRYFHNNEEDLDKTIKITQHNGQIQILLIEKQNRAKQSMY